MRRLLELRTAFAEYIQECLEGGEQPWSFRDWFDTCYYYDMVDEMPPGQVHNVTFSSYRAASLN